MTSALKIQANPRVQASLPWLAVLALVAARLFYVYLTPLDLAPDEAQYWLWSKFPDWSYYSKPPLVAWLIGLSTSLLGDTPLGVRLFAVLTVGVISLLVFYFLKRYWGTRAGWYGLLTFNLMPLTGLGGLMMTPDIATLLFWLLALFLLADGKAAPWPRFLMMGLFVGLAGLSKLTAGLFYPLAGLYLLVNRERRVWLTRPHFYVAGLVSLACLAPVWWWNYTHDFINFRHVAGQVGGEKFAPLETLGNFFGGQLAMTGGFLFFFLLFWWGRGPKRLTAEAGRLLWWFSLPLFAFFTLKAVGGKVQPNWPVLAVSVGALGMAAWAAGLPRWRRRLFEMSLALAAVITLVGHDTFLPRNMGVEFPVKRDPLKPVIGWRSVGQATSHYLAKMPENTVILTTRYQTASELAFYAKTASGQRPEVLYANPGYRRQNQFDLWPWPTDLTVRFTLYVNESNTLEPVVEKGFGRCEPLTPAVATRPLADGRELLLRRAFFWLCMDYKGIARIKPENY